MTAMTEIAKKITFSIKVISMILGISFNLVVIIVRAVKFFRHRKISSYHFIIIQVALADLIFASLIVFEVEEWKIDRDWKYSLAACRVVKPLRFVASSVPSLFMLLLAFERYMGIINTLTHRLRTRSIAIIGMVLWVFAYISYLPYLLALGFWVHPHNENQRWCVSNQWRSKEMEKGFQLYLFVVFLAIPLIFTTVFHCLIYHFVQKHTKKMSVHRQGTTTTLGELPLVCESTKGSESSTDTRFSSVADTDIMLTDNDGGQFKTIVVSLKSIDEDGEGCDNDEADDDVFSPRRRQSQAVRFTEGFRRMFNSSHHTIRQRIRRKMLSRKTQTKERKLKIHILLAITVCFFMCTFPYQLFYILHYFGHLSNYTGAKVVSRVFGTFIYLHCFINGIIYSIVDFKFRRDVYLIFKSILYMKPYYRRDLPRVSSTNTRSVQLSSTVGN